MRNLLGIIFLILYAVIQGSANSDPVHRVKRQIYLSDLLQDRQSGNVFYQGDIQLNNQDVNRILQGGKVGATLTWPNGIIPYKFSGEHNSTEIATIGRAMLEIQSKTCIRFVPRTTESDYIYINKKSPQLCFSFVGRNPLEHRQSLNLGVNCTLHGVIQHELMHAIGFWHEHSRHDRDDYITISKNLANLKRNYNKIPGYSNDRGLPYDYNSITHYGTDQGVFPIIGEVNIGQRKRISDLDVLGIKWMYNCPLLQPPPQNCGDVDPHFCPMLVRRFGCIVDVKESCMRSCNTCGSAPCQDTNDSCYFFKKQGYCWKHLDFARRACRKTCFHCY